MHVACAPDACIGRPIRVSGLLSTRRVPFCFQISPTPLMSNLHDLPDSPCIGICSTLFDEVCTGCGRTAGEVSNWVFLSDEEKATVWERIVREGTAVRFTRPTSS